MTEGKYMEDFGIPVVHLLKGVLYRQQELAWSLLVQYQNRIRDYLDVIGLELNINETDGYAFIKQKNIIEEERELYPTLMQRRPLSYLPTVLCVILRKRLLESDQTGTETRTVISLEQMKELISVFQATSGTNERKLEDKIETAVKRLVDYGFLIELKQERHKYEISRIINQYLDIETLKRVQTKLENYGKGEPEIEQEEKDGVES